MFSWKDPRVQFAIGAAVVFLAIKWLFTGTLLFAVGDLQADAPEGQTQAGFTLMALVPVLHDLIVSSLIAVGAWVVNLGGMIAGLFHPPAPQTAAENVVISDLDRQRKEVIELAQAAADNDREALEALRVQIRKPHALAELNQAYTEGDAEAAAKLKAELDAMVGAPAAARKSRGQNG